MPTPVPQPSADWSSLVDALRARAQWQSDQRAYVFLADGEGDERTLTYAQADLRARAVAAFLQRHLAVGHRALLVMPSGLDYVTGFFGCLYAGVAAVTAHTPRLHGALAQRDLRRLEAIAADCQPDVVLTSAEFLAEIRTARDDLAGLRGLPWKAVGAIPDMLAERWRDPAVAPRDTAFLQYTSGSTATPKGVIVSHANLVHNQRVMQQGFGHAPGTTIVSWLPLFHDMGLIGQMLHACWLGGTDVFLSPQAFVERPARWLEAISRYRGESSLAPNFGYDLCVRKVSAAQRDALDLSSLRVAGNASEPVRAATLDRFAEAFGPCGFNAQAAAPAYGLAEGTLIVTAGRAAGRRGPLIATFAAGSVERGLPLSAGDSDVAASRWVGSGRAVLDELLIVDPETRTAVNDGSCGEVWIRGGSVATGYWQRAEETEETFGATLADGAGPYLRTGDLGFLHQGELFVAGRIKDLIIVQGQNHYPQDIERTVDAAHAALRPGCGAAFAIEADDEERLVIVQETAAGATEPQLQQALAAIRTAVAAEHALEVSAVALLPPQTVWKTTSGKIQRRQCQQEFLAGRLPTIAQWQCAAVAAALAAHAEREQHQNAPAAAESTAQAETESTESQRWETRLRELLAELLGEDARALDRHAGFTTAGVDSALAVALAARLSVETGREVSPTWLFDYPNLAALAAKLADAAAAADAPPAASPTASPMASPVAGSFDVAVVGLACRFPGAENADEFWRNLAHGVDSVGVMPPQRFGLRRWHSSSGEAGEKPIGRWAGLLERLDEFDAELFGISPHEARWMDPQQRLLLELCWTALESAGWAGEALTGTPTGVFMGLSQSEYQSRLLAQGLEPDGFLASGNYLAMAANRLSYTLNLRGPSLTVDTACSSSLVAVHLALQSLRLGECAAAIVGGANVLLEPQPFVNFSRAGMLAADGRCKTFDQRADGYVRGEGAGVVLLKPLAAALRDGDRVLAVIKSSAVNQDGHTAGPTAPSGPAQTELVQQALAAAGLHPGDVSYVEAHGTGTALGDPIELTALARAFANQGRALRQTCAIGSVKTNIGHLEAAAGIAGLIKVCLMLEHGELPPSLNFEQPNRLLRFDESPFYVVDCLRCWPAGAGPRRAGVSSLGFGGANAHVVVEEFRSAEPAPAILAEPGQPELLALSARSPKALADLAHKFAEQLAEFEGLDDGRPAWRDVCNTAATGRAAWRFRLAVAADNPAEAERHLKAWLVGQRAQGLAVGEAPRGGAGRARVVCLTGPERGDALAEKVQSLVAPGGIVSWRNVAPDDAHDALAAPAGDETTLALVVGDEAELEAAGDLTAATAVIVDAQDLPRAALQLAAALWAHGVPLVWQALFPAPRRCVALPTYPFQRQSYWLLSAPVEEPPDAVAEAAAVAEAVAVKPSEPVVERPPLDAGPPSVAAVREGLRQRLAAALGAAPAAVELDANFHELGLDSVLAARVSQRLTQELGEEVQPILLYTFPTLRQLADGLLAEHPAAAARLHSHGESAGEATAAVVESAPLSSVVVAAEVEPEEDKAPPAPAPVELRGIAIIGLACKFPGAETPEEFWRLLCAGECTVGPVPLDRQPWFTRLLDACCAATAAQRELAGRGGFLAGVDRFDAALLGVSPTEARVMDPQQRLFLETAWQALESAGYAPRQRAEIRTGVFVGATTGDYVRYLDRAGAQLSPHAGSGNVATMIANRVSYLFDLHGPSLTLDTACSSSLAAVHTACQSLWRGEADVALAGGVNLALLPDNTLAYAQAGMISPTGLCHSFDDRADGYVRGEGVAAVLLKPLAQAVRDGDTIWAVIHGTAVNHDGHDKLGFTAPNPAAQAAVLRQAYAAAGVAPQAVTLLEAHGSGTPLGDPLEVSGLCEVFASDTEPAGRCALGTVKTNLGHLEAAAGIAGLIKATLALHHRQLPPTLHFESPNRRLSLAESPFYINDRLRPWDAVGPRYAGVSSFGAGGANAHVVLGEALLATEVNAVGDHGPFVLPLSAHSPAALDALERALLSRAIAEDAPPLADVCWTAAVGRIPLGLRRALVFAGRESLRAALAGDTQAANADAAGEIFRSASESIDAADMWRRWQSHVEPRLLALDAAAAAQLRSLCRGARFDEFVRPRLSVEQLAGSAVRFAELEPSERQSLYLAAAEIFTLGVDLDWSGLLPRGRRVPLPTYPFDRQRCWIDLPEPAELPESTPAAAAAADITPPAIVAARAPATPLSPPRGAGRPPAATALDAHFRQLVWRPDSFTLSPPEKLTGNWLVFARSDAWCGALLTDLKRRGANVTTVLAGNAFRHPELDRYEIQAVDPADFVRLRENLEREGRLPAKVVHAWPAAGPPGRDSAPAARQAVAESTLRSLLYLLPALAADHRVETLHVLTRASQAVCDEMPCRAPEQAAVWGFVRSAALEHTDVPMQCLDLPGDDAALDAELLRQVVGELAATDADEELALAPGRRWTSELANIDAAAWPPAPAPLRREGVYLVTGGLGGIGWRLVGRLLTRYQARVVVLSRRALPPQESWPQWLAGNPSHPQAVLVLQAQAWLAGGGQLLSLAGDVANETDLRQALATAEQRFGRVHGVFHLAGVNGDALIRNKDWKSTRAVLRPKLSGAWALDAALGDAPLDFCLMASSLAGVLGNVGQADYAAANRFLDSFAAWRSAGGRRTLAVAFGPWAGAGMAQEHPDSAFGDELDKLEEQTGLALLERAIESPLAHLAAAAWRITATAAEAESAVTPVADVEISELPVTVSDSQATPLAALPNSADEWRDELRRRVARALETAPDRVDVDRPLVELGIDSVLAVRLSQEIGRDTATSLPQTLLYDYPTVRKLAAALATRLGAAPEVDVAETAEASPLVTVEALVTPAGEWVEPGLEAVDAPVEPAVADTQQTTVPSVANASTAAPPQVELPAPIAVIGLGCRFPQADNPEQFWRNLRSGVDAVQEVPAWRWSALRHYSADRRDAGKSYSKWGALLGGVDQFDPLFFRIAPREAEEMDPQQRLLLETAWEALETAGYAAGQLSGTHTGVFVGAMPSEYLHNLLARRDGPQSYAGTGTALSTIANRLSYFLNLHGPCLAIDTACSSSLVAVHLAVEALRSGQCEYAIAAGTQAGLSLAHWQMLSRLGALSPDGRCRPFDRGANGYVLGEGVGVAVLKRLDQALADGDHVWGVIRGTAINHGGQAAGLTVPSFSAQAEVIRAALADAGVTADTVSYIEAHGTGTALGDPIEIQGLCEAFRDGASRRQFCALGSVKSNIGHLEPAAGIASLIKLMLCLTHGELPATLHVRQVNPALELEQTPFYVQDRLTPWQPRGTGPRRAGISSFGFGGANAHVVVEQAPAAGERTAAPDRPCHLALLSARSPAALSELAARLEQHLKSTPDGSLADVCFSLAVGRPQHAVRLATVATSREELQQRLRNFVEGTADSNIVVQDRPPAGPVRVAWILGGAGRMRRGACRDLFETSPTFRSYLASCAAAVDAELESPLLELLYGGDDGMPLPVAVAAPAALALQLALARTWEAWGAEPQWLAGDGWGEAAAACLAGAVSVEELLPLAARQARLLAQMSDGLIEVDVTGDTAGLRARMANFSSQLGLAETLSPTTAVLGGPSAVVERFARQLEADGFSVSTPRPASAAHLPAGEAAGDQIEALWRGAVQRPTRVGIVSSLAGQPLAAGHTFSAGYWREQARCTAQVGTIFERLPELGCDLVLDLRLGGAGPAAPNAATLPVISALGADHQSWPALLMAAARLSMVGVDVDWAAVDRGQRRRRVPLPTYPFERQRYWIDAPPEADVAEAPVVAAIESPASPPAPAEETPATAAPRDVTGVVRQVFAGVLHLRPEELDATRSFQEHGVDSLMAEDAVLQLEDALGLPSLLPTVLFQHPTIERLAAHLQSRLAASSAVVESPPTDVPPEAARTATTSTSTDRATVRHDIAIVGLAGRFPQADDVEQLWRLLAAGQSAVGPMPDERWELAAQYDPAVAALLQGDRPRGGFLTAIDRFDPAFFRLSPAEANQMDPRQRLFLETAYRAVEQAGYGGRRLEQTRTGVFVGCGAEDYVTGLPPEMFTEHTAIGGTAATLPSRLAYFLNLQGPCLAVDTACSSALVALHLAVQSLRRGECDFALAGGVHLHLRLTSILALRRMGALSADGVCRAFAAAANGFVPGEGVGAVVLRPLSDAQASGDRIWGVIRGTAVTNDGRTNGLAAPSPAAQREALSAAWRDAGILPDELDYVEAHGTGTPLGDPIEVQALCEALNEGGAVVRRGDRRCGIGSIKTNLGHADAAAGMASLFKVLLAMAHESLPASLNVAQLNPRLPWGEMPVEVLQTSQAWPQGLRPRLAGVSAFGFSGANAHVVLAEPPAVATPSTAAEEPITCVLPLSATHPSALAELARRWLDDWPRLCAQPWLDACWTAVQGRMHHAQRAAIVASSWEQARPQLAAVAAGKPLATDHGDATALRYLAGDDVDWSAYFAGLGVERRPVATLPATPQHRQRCWLPGWESFRRPSAVEATPAESQPVAETVDPQMAPHVPTIETAEDRAIIPPVAQTGVALQVERVVWQPLDALPAAANSGAATVVFHTEAEWQLRLVERLRATGRPVIQVLSAKSFHRYDAQRYTLAPLDRAGCQRILSEAAAQAPAVRVVHLWSCRRPLDDSWWAQHVDEQLTYGVRSVLTLLQALADSQSQRDWRLYLVTRGAQPVAVDADCRQPFDAASWGLLRAASHELPYVRMHAVDLAADDEPPAENDLDALWAALAGDATPGELAVRGAALLQPARQAIAAQGDAPYAKAEAAPIVRRGGVYLLTGGLGALGVRAGDWLIDLALAEETADGPPLTLVCATRTALPPVDQWPAWLAAHEKEPAADRVRAVQRWQARGAVVHLAVVDVSNAQQAAALASHVRQRFGHIDGVLHLAGAVGAAPLRDMSRSEFGAVLQTKLVGAWALDRALSDDPPAWFASFSSVAGWQGNALQGHYSAASRFLDAFAAWQSARGRRGRSLAWGLWRGLGMADTATARERGDSGLDPAAALAQLSEALRSDDSLRIVDVAARRVSSAARKEQAAREPANTTSASAATDWPAVICQTLAQTLEGPPVELEPRRGFVDYGVDSLLALKFARLLSAQLGRELPGTLLFDYPNVEALAAHLAEVCAEDPRPMTEQRESAFQPREGTFRLSSGRQVRRLTPAPR